MSLNFRLMLKFLDIIHMVVILNLNIILKNIYLV